MSTQFAFVFPGQGSQKVGMLSDLLDQAAVRDTFLEASEALGQDLLLLTQEGPEAELNKTELTQPALLTASVAIWRRWLAAGGAQPSALAGHSLGEYSALVCAGALELADAVRLVNKRGQFMQSAVPAGVGAMAAIIGLDDAAVKAACIDAAQSEVVEPVNFNSPGQVVIAGNAQAVERAMIACKTAGAKRALPLPVSVPSHCALMQPAADQLAVELDAICVKTPVLPVYQNVSAALVSDPDLIRKNLVAQLYSPVRWVESVQAMAAAGVTATYECGPGKVLSGLNKRIDRGLATGTLDNAASLDSLLSALAN